MYTWYRVLILVPCVTRGIGYLYLSHVYVSAAASSSAGVLNEATVDSLLLAALEQFEDEAMDRLLLSALEEYEEAGTMKM